MLTLLTMWVLAADPSPGVAAGKLTLPGPASPSDAVVFLDGFEAPTPKKGRPSMTQRNKAFEPSAVVVQVGEQVLFPNEDKVFHNVFSLTTGNEFDLGLYRQGSSKAVRFQRAGVVDVFCNIHPDMIGAILVVENPHWVRPAADGTFKLSLPAGKRTIAAWWPKGRIIRKEIEVPPGGEVAVDFALTGDKGDRHTNKFGQPYGRYK